MPPGEPGAPEPPQRGKDATEAGDNPEVPRRVTRATKLSTKAQEAMVPLERGAEMRGVPNTATRIEGTDKRTTKQATQVPVSGSSNATRSEGTDGRTTSQQLLAMMTEMSATIASLRNDMRGLKERRAKDGDELRAVKEELQGARAEICDTRNIIQALEKTVEKLAMTTKDLPTRMPSYADAVREVMSSQTPVARNIATNNAPAATHPGTNNAAGAGHNFPPRITIDTAGVAEEDKKKTEVAVIRQRIEREMQAKEGQGNWRCAAVAKDARVPGRIRIVGRNDAEVQQVKEAVKKLAIPGVQIMPDQLYPVKVDNANRTNVIDAHGAICPDTVEALAKENGVKIAKIRWLSRRDNNKAYGSMVVYLTNGADAVRMLQTEYFNIAGESANVRVFETRQGPTQCYNCQEMGHKALACPKAQVCAKCAEIGHGHKECQGREPKCALCGGKHASFSRECRVRLHQL